VVWKLNLSLTPVKFAIITYVCVLFVLLVIKLCIYPPCSSINMSATRRIASDKTCHTAPYNLTGTSKAQITALTVAALKSHLKHFKLPTTGNTSALINCLFSHLQSSQTDTSQGDVTNHSQHNSQENGTILTRRCSQSLST